MILSMLGKLDPQPSPGGIVGDRTDLDGAGIKNALASMADWTKTAVNAAFEGPAAIKEAVGETLTNLQSVNDVMDNSFMVNTAFDIVTRNPNAGRNLVLGGIGQQSSDIGLDFAETHQNAITDKIEASFEVGQQRLAEMGSIPAEQLDESAELGMSMDMSPAPPGPGGVKKKRDLSR